MLYPVMEWLEDALGAPMHGNNGDGTHAMDDDDEDDEDEEDDKKKENSSDSAGGNSNASSSSSSALRAKRRQQRRNKVFVHCHRGVSRSAAMVIAWLMHARGWDYESTFKHVKQKRGIANPNVVCVVAVPF